MLYDLWQNKRIGDAERSAIKATHKATSSAGQLKQHIADLEDELGRHALVIKTLVATCEQAGVFKRDAFMELKDIIDAQDGSVDGKVTKGNSPKTCSSCGKVSNKRANKCIWCGTELRTDELL